jgi:hypothetical protein
MVTQLRNKYEHARENEESDEETQRKQALIVLHMHSPEQILTQ